MTLNSGWISSSDQASHSPSPDQYPSQTFKPSRTPVQALESASRLDTGGALGAYSQVGSWTDKILAGQKLLASSSLHSTSYHPATAALISRFTETTKELSKDGGKGTVETGRRMLSSTAFIPFLEPNNAWSTQDMFPARTTQLTSHPKEHTHILHILCPTYPSPQSYTNSLQTLTQNSPLQTMVSSSQQMSYPSPTACFLTMNVP